jgi:cytochrome c oxidase subunit IV
MHKHYTVAFSNSASRYHRDRMTARRYSRWLYIFVGMCLYAGCILTGVMLALVVLHNV